MVAVYEFWPASGEDGYWEKSFSFMFVKTWENGYFQVYGVSSRYGNSGEKILTVKDFRETYPDHTPGRFANSKFLRWE